MDKINLDRDSKAYADKMCETLTGAGIKSQIENPEDSFYAGVYFGICRGVEKGVNMMFEKAVEALPTVFNEVAKSGFDMSIDWKQRYSNILFNSAFETQKTNQQ